MQLVEEAKQICQQRLKLLEQRQLDLAVKTTSVEEALRKGDGALDQQERPLAIGEYKTDVIVYVIVKFRHKSYLFWFCRFYVTEEFGSIFPS